MELSTTVIYFTFDSFFSKFIQASFLLYGGDIAYAGKAQRNILVFPILFFCQPNLGSMGVFRKEYIPLNHFQT